MVRHTFARGTHRTWALRLGSGQVIVAALCTALLLAAGIASAKEAAQPKADAAVSAARHMIVVGQKPIQIPVPSGFVEPSLKVPGFAVIGEQFTPPSNRYLAMFVTPEDMAAAGTSKEPTMRRYFLVQTLRAMEAKDLSVRDFAEGRKAIRDNYKQLMAMVAPEVQKQVQKAAGNLSELSGKKLEMQVGQMLPLEVFHDSEQALSLLALTNYRASVNGKAEDFQVAMSITTAIVQGRLVYFYTYSRNETKDDMVWVRRKATEWVEALGAR
jgi:hypothetical protein